MLTRPSRLVMLLQVDIIIIPHSLDYSRLQLSATFKVGYNVMSWPYHIPCESSYPLVLSLQTTTEHNPQSWLWCHELTLSYPLWIIILLSVITPDNNWTQPSRSGMASRVDCIIALGFGYATPDWTFSHLLLLAMSTRVRPYCTP